MPTGSSSSVRPTGTAPGAPGGARLRAAAGAASAGLPTGDMPGTSACAPSQTDAAAVPTAALATSPAALLCSAGTVSVCSALVLPGSDKSAWGALQAGPRPTTPASPSPQHDAPAMQAASLRSMQLPPALPGWLAPTPGVRAAHATAQLPVPAALFCCIPAAHATAGAATAASRWHSAPPSFPCAAPLVTDPASAAPV